MHPELHLGPLTLPTYTTIFVLAVAIAWTLFLVRTSRMGYFWPRVLFGLALSFPIGVLGARGVALAVEHLSAGNTSGDPGMSVLGAMIACTVYGIWVIPRLFGEAPWRLLDALAFSLPLCLMIGRFACLAHGCCFGAPAEASPVAALLGIELGSYVLGTPARAFYAGAPDTLLLWNTPLLLTLQSALALVAVEAVYRRRPPVGVTAALALVLDAGGRLLIEPTRGGRWVTEQAANPWQLTTLGLLVAGLALLAVRWHRRAWPHQAVLDPPGKRCDNP